MGQNDLRSLKGVGPSLETKLNNLDIYNQTDLLFHLPSRYEDRTTIKKIGALESDTEARGLTGISTLASSRRKACMCGLVVCGSPPFISLFRGRVLLSAPLSTVSSAELSPSAFSMRRWAS